MTDATLDISIVIVSWNVKRLLRKCLRSIYNSTQGQQFEIFVVDNASRDGTPEMVRAEFPDVHLIANSDNVGFGRANNQALRLCKGRYVLLTNPDTVIPPDAIHRMIAFMKRRPRAGLVGPELVGEHGQLPVNWVRWSPVHFFEFIIENIVSMVSGQTHILFRRPHRVNILTGACWMTRYETMAEIGLYDEDFFMYAEEPDVCTRMRDAGWEIWLLRDILVTHYKGQSVRLHKWGWHLPIFARSMTLWLTKRWRTKLSALS
ncbi:MAG: glycosyltransferase family 2 protein [Chloroflexota bacterium]|nr:glycosyltransferase family 2 protein [Chloroflexota bacterium]